jgi:hypothetical protein
MLTRRDVLQTAVAGAVLALDARFGWAQGNSVITKAIPATGERLPIVGLGSSATFSQVAGAADLEAISGVFKAMLEQGGKVFDTAPGYGGQRSRGP